MFLNILCVQDKRNTLHQIDLVGWWSDWGGGGVSAELLGALADPAAGESQVKLGERLPASEG